MLDGLKMILRSAQDDSLVRAISNDDFVIRSSVMTSTHAISVSPLLFFLFWRRDLSQGAFDRLADDENRKRDAEGDE